MRGRKIKEKLMHLIQEINVVIVAFVKFLTYNLTLVSSIKI